MVKLYLCNVWNIIGLNYVQDMRMVMHIHEPTHRWLRARYLFLYSMNGLMCARLMLIAGCLRWNYDLEDVFYRQYDIFLTSVVIKQEFYLDFCYLILTVLGVPLFCVMLHYMIFYQSHLNHIDLVKYDLIVRNYEQFYPKFSKTIAIKRYQMIIKEIFLIGHLLRSENRLKFYTIHRLAYYPKLSLKRRSRMLVIMYVFQLTTKLAYVLFGKL